MAGLRSASEPYAQLLARRSRDSLGATWGLAETGAAGPTGNRYGDAAGHTCLAVSGAIEMVRTLETGSPDRPANMQAFAVAALTLLDEALSAA
jgi:nicotinamide mononucleotide (NMN) deamidase PncC